MEQLIVFLVLIATFRAEVMGSSFSMFDFAPVGIVLALLGLLFICLLGWRFLPKRNTQETE